MSMCNVGYTFAEETWTIYDSLNLSEEELQNLERIIAQLQLFPKVVISETLKWHIFSYRNQDGGEKFDDFIINLKVFSRNNTWKNMEHPAMSQNESK